MPVFHVRHVTQYRYARPVVLEEHRMMLRPRDSYDQRLLAAELDIDPEPAGLRWIHDVFGNVVAIADFGSRAAELRVASRIAVEHSAEPIPNLQTESYAERWPFDYAADELIDLQPSIDRGYPDPAGAVGEWARRFVNKGRSTPVGELLMALTHGIKEGFGYRRRTEQGVQDPATTLELGSGSCRDLAILMMEAARALGLAARFVTGYIYVPSRDGPVRLGGGSTHAWCQVYLPGAGWVEFDPTNGIVGSEHLIRIGVTRDPRQAVPLHGTWRGRAGDALGMTVEVQVTQAGTVAAGNPPAAPAFG